MYNFSEGSPKMEMLATKVRRKYKLIKTSLLVQTQEFFINSTLHGVRYIAEKDRPFFDRFLWWACTSVGATVTLIIIVSLWEKFQTNPTITGLDTDFHNWDVEFPAVSLCQTFPYDPKSPSNVQGISNSAEIVDFLSSLATLSSNSIHNFERFAYIDKLSQVNVLPIKDLAYVTVNKCKDVLSNCTFKGEEIDCCDYFHPIFTENGFCHTFNMHPSQGVFRNDGKNISNFKQEYIYETDMKWSIEFKANNIEENPINVYLHSSNEQPGIDLDVHIIWDGRITTLSFLAKTTYTMQDARQLSIKQRRCVFPDEIRLSTDTVYSYGGCLRECRMKMANKLCGCIPCYYKAVRGYHHCNISEMACLSGYEDILKSKTICQCELGCDNTIYEVEKLSESQTESGPRSLEIAFVSWPMVRYKREVLFGWVDLLVSFGGIAGLFLGFSLLSGVEIIYYFTIRACCMVMREQDTLEEIAERRRRAEKPQLDLSFTPFFMRDDEHDQSQLHYVKPLRY